MDEFDTTASEAPVEAEPVDVGPEEAEPVEAEPSELPRGDDPTVSPDPTGEGTPNP